MSKILVELQYNTLLEVSGAQLDMLLRCKSYSEKYKNGNKYIKLDENSIEVKIIKGRDIFQSEKDYNSFIKNLEENSKNLVEESHDGN